jgi:predicted TIM-barrel fold metal-dependent hydrolase
VGKYIDCHCHVFNEKENITLWLVIKIILSLPDILAKRVKSSHAHTFDKIQSKNESLKYILNFLKAGMSNSVDDIFRLMDKVYNGNYKIVPLMFDLEYCFIANRAAGKQMPVSIPSDIQIQFEKIINELYQVHTQAFDLLNELNELNKKMRDTSALKTAIRSNFDIQLEDISQLKAHFPNEVFPFFAIDPRRTGIIDRFINEISPKDIFAGIKLYTSNGYSPTDDDLMKPGGLYDFCCKNNIPITAHNSYGGFATPLEVVEIFGDVYINNTVKPVHGNVSFIKVFSKGWVQDRATKLNHPEIWKKVLTKYPNLKLNLAHFGYGNPTWQKTLFSMMETYPNLYTDISCWTDINDIINFRTNYFLKASNKVKNKILYGSDFYLDLLFIDSFQHYVNNFLQVFSQGEFTQIAKSNPEKFLK